MGGSRGLRSFFANGSFLSNWRLGRVLRDQRGVASLEFASSLPLLILILLGTIDFGRFAYSAIAVTNAARTGAAFCNYWNASDCDSEIVDDVRGLVIRAAPTLSLQDSQITVTPPTGVGADCPAQCLSVLIVYPFSTLLPIPRPEANGAWVWAPVTVTVVRSASMRVGLS